MKVEYGKGKSEYGTGIDIKLSDNELADAIMQYLKTYNIYVNGPRTITVNNELIKKGRVYVDPSGFVNYDGKKFSGRGNE